MTEETKTIIIRDDENTELAKSQELQAMIPQQYKIDAETIFMIQMLAPAFHQCRFYNLASEAQAIAVMLKAAGLGIPPTSAFDFFDIIEGRPALKPAGAHALIQRSGMVTVEIDNDSYDYCRVKMTRLDTGFSHEVIYTIEEAKRSGLIKSDKPNSAWQRWHKDMLRNRALGRCAKIVAYDIIGGMPLTTELEEARPIRQIGSTHKPQLLEIDCNHLNATKDDRTCPDCGMEFLR